MSIYPKSATYTINNYQAETTTEVELVPAGKKCLRSLKLANYTVM